MGHAKRASPYGSIKFQAPASAPQGGVSRRQAKYCINSNVPNSSVKTRIVLVIENLDLEFVWDLWFGIWILDGRTPRVIKIR